MTEIIQLQEKSCDKTSNNTKVTQIFFIFCYGLLCSFEYLKITKCNTLITATIPVHTEQTTSAVDFYPSCYTGVVYISEADIIEGCAYKRKVARLRKVKSLGFVCFLNKR